MKNHVYFLLCIDGKVVRNWKRPPRRLIKFKRPTTEGNVALGVKEGNPHAALKIEVYSKHRNSSVYTAAPKDVYNSEYKNKNKMFIYLSHCTVEDSLM
jgi:hypothetical protein